MKKIGSTLVAKSSKKRSKGKDVPVGEKVFVLVDGLRFEKTSYGLIYSPEYQKESRKHQCSDCMTCAWCSDPRCSACRSGKLAKKEGKDFPVIR